MALDVLSRGGYAFTAPHHKLVRERGTFIELLYFSLNGAVYLAVCLQQDCLHGCCTGGTFVAVGKAGQKICMLRFFLQI